MAMWMIAWANIRKKKGVACSLGILVFLAAALFNVGLVLLTGIGSFYDRENERLDGPDYVVRFGGNAYKEEYLDFFLQDERVEQAETEEVILMNITSLPEGGSMSCTFRKLDEARCIKGFERAEASGSFSDGEILVPLYFKKMGLDPGDTLTLKFKKQDYSFVIGGYTRSTWFHSSVSSMADIYMTDQAYEQLYAQIGGGYLLRVQVKEGTKIGELKADFRDHTDVVMEAITVDSEVMEFTIDEMRTGCTMLVTILSAILFAFSSIIVVVVLIVIRFRISNHIKAQMQNIGALGAMGYTGRQIQWSIAWEFLAIGLCGTVLGILASYGFLGALSGVVTSSMGVTWGNGIHIGTDFVSGVLVMAVLLLVSQWTAAKAARILPAKALRGGLESHNFEKNHFPLDSAVGSLSTVLGLKSIMFHKKTYAMVGTIFAGVAFACGFAVVLFWNMGMDDHLLIQMSGYEISDLLVYGAPHTDLEPLRKDIEQVDGVRKTSLYEAASASIQGELVTTYVSDDFGRLETVEVYEGAFPVYDNEVALTGVLAKAWGKEIGDTIELSHDGVRAEYLICGLGQTMSNFGRQCFLSLEGQRRIDPAYEMRSIQVYLEPGMDEKEYIRMLEQQFRTISPSMEMGAKTDEAAKARRTAEEKLTNLLSMYGADSAQYALMVDGEIALSGDTSEYRIERIENNRDLFVSNIGSIIPVAVMVALVILIGTLWIITLVFYMVIKSMIVRRRHEFGIYKAIGYTDQQLMKQVSVSFLPVSAAGTIFGTLVSCVTVNRLSSMLFQGLGVSRMAFVVNPWAVMAMGVFIILYSFGISMAVAGKIKGISVYRLLTEE